MCIDGPLFAENRQDLNGCAWGTSPSLWDGGNLSAESGVVHRVDYDTENSVRLFVRVGLELGVDHDDERRSHSRKQTSLSSNLVRVSGRYARLTNLNVVDRSSSYQGR